MEEGETDHLRSVGRQHKPAGEGRPLSDSVLQTDKKRDGEKGDGNEENDSRRHRERMENGQDGHRDKDIERRLKSETEVSLVVENHPCV